MQNVHISLRITFFKMVSLFHVSTPFKNAFVEVPIYHTQSTEAVRKAECSARATAVLLVITYKENNE